MSSTTSWPTRLPLLLLCLITGVFTVGQTPPLLVTVPATILLLMVCAATRLRGGEAAFVGAAGLVVAVVTVLAPVQLVVIAMSTLPLGVPVTLVAAAAVSTVVAALRPRWFYPHLALQAGLLAVMIENVSPRGDVKILVEDSLKGLIAGHNPYALTFPNPYSKEDTEQFWPAEFIAGDRIDVGFPYLPGALIGDLPAYALGEVRYASAAAVLIAAALAWRLTSEVAGRAMVAALPTSVLAMTTVVGYWVEPLMLLGVALLAWAISRGSALAGVVGLVLVLTVKQYVVVLLPLERLVRQRLGVRSLLVGVVGAAALVGGFFLAGPADFWRSVVQLQLNANFRFDSTSLSVDLVRLGVPLPLWTLAIASVGAGLAVATWVRTTARASVTWTVLGMGLAILATVLLSKAGHVNYYFVVYGCLVIGFAAWPGELGSSADRTRGGRRESVLVEGDQRQA